MINSSQILPNSISKIQSKMKKHLEQAKNMGLGSYKPGRKVICLGNFSHPCSASTLYTIQMY